MMGTVTEIDDGLSYITDENESIQAVQWFKRNQYVEFRNDGTVSAFNKTDASGMQRHELKNLMVMWLALNYPDVLNYDVEENEQKIRTETE